ncbi:LIM domain-containing protein [Ditylenchus destructor]|nr:LIM domain-containing protein [Ditylenchus destructor]
MDFGSGKSSQKAGKCATCKQEVIKGEEMMVERQTVHKKCFTCGYCGSVLHLGACATDHSLSVAKYGRIWFCQEHMLMSPAEKSAKLDERTKGKK